MPTPRPLTWIATAGLFLLAASAAAQPTTAPAAPTGHITIGPDTTRVSGPVLPDGTIDYVAAYNAHLSAGVTADNNAAVLVVRAFGPGALKPSIRERFLTDLGLQDLPDQGPYWEDSDEELSQALDVCRRGPWRAEDQPDVAAWLETNAPALALLTQAAQRTRYWMPALTPDPKGFSMITVLLPNLGKMRHAAGALDARAMLRLGKGDLAGARADLLTIHRLARLTAQGGTLIERLVGIACDVMASRADAAWAGDPGVTAGLARQYLDQLQALPSMPSLHDAFDSGERFMLLDVVMTVCRKGDLKSLAPAFAGGGEAPELPPDLSAANIDWNTVLRIANQWYDREAVILDSPYLEQAALWKKFEDDVKACKTSIATEPDPSQRLAKSLIGMLVPALQGVGKSREKGAMQFELAQVALAARTFYADKGQWPDQLSDLVPGYLKALPADRFTAKQPLQMRIDQGALLIWSVGPEGKGYTGDTTKDLAVRLHIQ
jgi:hypothetical protein